MIGRLRECEENGADGGEGERAWLLDGVEWTVLMGLVSRGI